MESGLVKQCKLAPHPRTFGLQLHKKQQSDVAHKVEDKHLRKEEEQLASKAYNDCNDLHICYLHVFYIRDSPLKLSTNTVNVRSASPILAAPIVLFVGLRCDLMSY